MLDRRKTPCPKCGRIHAHNCSPKALAARRGNVSSSPPPLPGVPAWAPGELAAEGIDVVQMARTAQDLSADELRRRIRTLRAITAVYGDELGRRITPPAPTAPTPAAATAAPSRAPRAVPPPSAPPTPALELPPDVERYVRPSAAAAAPGAAADGPAEPTATTANKPRKRSGRSAPK